MTDLNTFLLDLLPYMIPLPIVLPAIAAALVALRRFRAPLLRRSSTK